MHMNIVCMNVTGAEVFTDASKHAAITWINDNNLTVVRTFQEGGDYVFFVTPDKPWVSERRRNRTVYPPSV